MADEGHEWVGDDRYGRHLTRCWSVGLRSRGWPRSRVRGRPAPRGAWVEVWTSAWTCRRCGLDVVLPACSTGPSPCLETVRDHFMREYVGGASCGEVLARGVLGS